MKEAWNEKAKTERVRREKEVDGKRWKARCWRTF